MKKIILKNEKICHESWISIGRSCFRSGVTGKTLEKMNLSRHLTTAVISTCGWAGVDSAWKQEKLEARKKLKKRKEQMQYPRFQALGWPIGSGAVESGNKLVVQARLKGAGMHWAESNVNPMLAIRNILCSGRWREEWPRIESRLRLLAQQRQRQRYRSRHPLPPTSHVVRALQGDLDPLPVDPPVASKPKNNSWRKFKHGKALLQHPTHPKL